MYNAADRESYSQFKDSGITLVKIYFRINYSKEFIKDLFAKINSNGYVFTTPPVLLTASCKLDMANYPFDERICILKYSRLI